MHGKFVSGEKALLDQIIDDFGHCARGRLIQFHEALHGTFKNWNNLDEFLNVALKKAKLLPAPLTKDGELLTFLSSLTTGHKS